MAKPEPGPFDPDRNNPLMVVTPVDNRSYCTQRDLMHELRLHGRKTKRVCPFELFISTHNLAVVMKLLNIGTDALQPGVDPGAHHQLEPKLVLQRLRRLGDDWLECRPAPQLDWSGPLLMTRDAAAAESVDTQCGQDMSPRALRRYFTMLQFIALECERREQRVMLGHWTLSSHVDESKD